MILSEHIDFSSSNIDEDGGIAHDVLICGETSKRGRTYPREVRAKAKSLYEGAKVNLDHHLTRSASVTEGFGRLVNIRDDENGLRGDLEFLISHPFAKRFVEMGNKMPEQIGFSHVVDARASGGRGKEVVEEIHQVFSVDLVRDPATTKGIFESADDPDHLRQSLFDIAQNPIATVANLKESVMLLFEDQAGKSSTSGDSDDKGKTHQEDEKQEGGEFKQVSPDAKDGTALSEVKAVCESAMTLVEELKTLREELVETKRELDISSCMVAHQIDRTRLSEEQLAYLQSRPDRAAMDTYAESLPPMTRSAPPSIRPTAKTQSGDYKTMRESMAKRHRFSVAS